MTTKTLPNVDSDVEEIRRLTSDYAWAIDRFELDELMELFTEDGVFDMTPLGAPAASEGQAAVREGFAALIAGLKDCVHMMMNHRIDVQGNTATGTSYCHAFMISADGEKADNLITYEDTYAREASGWKFRSRIIKPSLNEA